MPLSPLAFEQNVIALVWDFDKTLISGYMQAPLFARFGVDSGQFWNEVNHLVAHYAQQGIRANPDTIYLNHLLTYVQHGPLKGLSNAILKEMGSELTFYPGLPDFFAQIQSEIESVPDFSAFGIHLEHYVVSTGFAETIRGSVIAPLVENIYACEFIEIPAYPGYLENPRPLDSAPRQICQVAEALDNTSKTRFLFEVNKGCNKFPEINVHAKLNPENRRIPFTNMVYIADGPSDVPAFSIVNSGGGFTYAIYPAGDRQAMRQVNSLRSDGRIQMFGEADYRPGSQTNLWLIETVRSIAERIVEDRQNRIRNSTSRPPRHL